MSCLDLQVAAHQPASQLFGEDVERQHASTAQAAEDALTPVEQIGGGRSLVQTGATLRRPVSHGKEVVVAQKHPTRATVERSVKARGRRVYVDFLQNIQGKTLATAYSARASEYAGVSAPLTWREVEDGVTRESFTIDTMPTRFREAGDPWKVFRSAKGVDLERATRYGGKR